MIRLIQLLKRAPGVSPEHFTSLWRDVHGPMIAGAQTSLDLLRYVQTHPAPEARTLESDASAARGGTLPPCDGIEEFWWRTESDLKRALDTDAGRHAWQHIVAHERSFTDIEFSPVWLAHEHPQVSAVLGRTVAAPKTGIVKMHFAFHQLPALSVAEAQRYWLTEHGPLVRSHAQARGLIAYNQVHQCESDLESLIRTVRGTRAPPYIGHAEAWFDRLTVRNGPETQDARAAAIADEAKFIDWSRATILVGKELVFVDRNWI